MLKRIKEIKNVGTFSRVNSAQYEFDKFTIIYGANSYGKSTLCDIFVSLKNNNSDPIEKRMTITSTDQPIVTLSFSKDSHEIDVKYKNQLWEVGQFDEKFEIFDTEFVHRNVFANNSEISQDNRNNFTEFVLGEKSIIAAKALQRLNDEKNDIDRKCKVIEERIAKCGYSINDLLEIPYKENIDEEDSLCLGLKTNINDQEKNKKNIGVIKNLPLPSCLDSIYDSYSEFLKLNSVLESRFSFEADDLVERFNEHKSKYASKVKEINLDNWLQTGTEYMKNDICPFCGQSIIGNDLIHSYFIVFSDEFKKYNNSIQMLTVKNTENDFYKLELHIQQNIKQMEEIYGKTLNREIYELKTEAISLMEDLLSVAREYYQILANLQMQFETLINEKQKDKYNPVATVPLDVLKVCYNKLIANLKSVNIYINKFCELSHNELNNFSIESIDKKIDELKAEYLKLDKICKRNLNNDAVSEYMFLQNERVKNRAEEKKQKEEFDAQQKKFLDDFFNDINIYFTRLGSRNFSIEIETSNRGINKTYSLKLRYKGNSIPQSNIRYVLSESDKRALALAIFLSKLKQSNVANTIIILDDPISSFDLDRMEAFTNILKELYGGVSQIIILTHYKDFYMNLAGWTSRYFSNRSLLKIISKPESNSIQRINKEDDTLLMDEFQESLFDMVSFICGKSEVYNAVSARVFMEKFLTFYFMLEIKENNIQATNLDTLLVNLRDNHLIGQEQYTKLDIKREEYNIPAHGFDRYSIESKRNSLRELYDLLHSISKNC